MAYVETLAILIPEPNSKCLIISILKKQVRVTNVFKSPSTISILNPRQSL